VNYGLLAKFQV